MVAILYPVEWHGDEDTFRQEVDALRAVSPRVEVVVERYVETHELRTSRSRTQDDSLRSQVAPLTAAQRAVMQRMHVAITADLPFDVPEWSPNLAWVQAVGAGTAHLQTAGLRQARIRLTNAAGSNAAAIAEFVFGRLLADAKRFRELEALQQQRCWDSRYGTQLAGTTIGLIGFGAINSAVARRAIAMDMRVVATRRSATTLSKADAVDVMYPASALRAMLAECDAVVAAVPETPETHHLIDRAALASMKRGAFFVNVGRGSLVDERALVDALRSGHLRGAALDVVSTEPLPRDSALWNVPNLYLSPHCASSPAAHFRNLHQHFRANLRRFLDGVPLRNEVDLTRGY